MSKVDINEFFALIQIKQRLDEIGKESHKVRKVNGQKSTIYLLFSLCCSVAVIVFDAWIMIIPQLMFLALMFRVIQDSKRRHKKYMKELGEIEEELHAYGISNRRITP